MVTAAEGLDVSIETGELVGVIGPNSAGKTTFLNLLTGCVHPQAGRIEMLGQDIVGKRPAQVTALGVGRSFQTAQLFADLTVLDNVLVALSTHEGTALRWWSRLHRDDRVARARSILHRFGMEEEAGQRVSETSEGARKLLDVALAFALDPTLLLLDEPTAASAWRRSSR
jgi:branched-chain amino acid transport system ATP-binding protein